MKRNQAYLARYGNNEQKEADLKELYRVESFASAAEEKNNIKEAKSIRNDLATFNRPDLLFELKQCINKSYGENAFCIGSAFESDHQLGALFFQKVIHYVDNFFAESLKIIQNDPDLHRRQHRRPKYSNRALHHYQQPESFQFQRNPNSAAFEQLQPKLPPRSYQDLTSSR